MPLRSDNFNRANGVLGTPSDGGSAWVDPTSNFNVVSNQAGASGSGNQAPAVLEASASDVVIKATSSNLSRFFGLSARYSDSSNYIYAAFDAVSGNYTIN